MCSSKLEIKDEILFKVFETKVISRFVAQIKEEPASKMNLMERG